MLHHCFYVFSSYSRTAQVASPQPDVYDSFNTEFSVVENPISPAGLLTTKYRVIVNKATMRSGPGTDYSAIGILYKNDVVWVWSISNGYSKDSKQ